jgi:hypothetical protein
MSNTENEARKEFSILDIAKLSPLQLSNKIFTYDRKLIEGDLSKINDVRNADLEDIIANLRCMRGLERDYVPRFSFF